MKMTQKSILITGANSGMGKALSLKFASEGYKVIMLCRDSSRGNQALQEVIEKTKNHDTELLLCDLASLDSIRKATTGFLTHHQKLDILVNNAGVILPGYHLTQDGFELQFGVNHLGHFLLTALLFPSLKKCAPSRIINVASGAHHVGKIHFDDIHLKQNFSFVRAYAQSKLANILFTYELSERAKGSQVTVNCLHPGAVATEMGIDRKTGFGRSITQFLKPFFLSPEAGADTTYFLSTAQEVAGITGKYFYRRKEKKSSPLSYDQETAKKLWDLSEKLVGLTFQP